MVMMATCSLMTRVLLLLTLLSPQAHAQPVAPNRVLDLDGKDSYVELPANLFTNEVITVEGWVKWRELGLIFPHLKLTISGLVAWCKALSDAALASIRKPILVGLS